MLNNALCFALYLPFVSFVFLTAIITVRVNYPEILATLEILKLLNQKKIRNIYCVFVVVHFIGFILI